ncbi:uncharacterized protein A4U43_C01F26350 [Asparagus officinalis]|uniref:Uncharacterized protein n=1 Tax=Asparagus officinalis TaxID=4686 RepID=A0A5P1FSA3_ASPOF|nr:uncharacterized protein A4U43_C01F26350 [Asparagus officinalis]
MITVAYSPARVNVSPAKQIIGPMQHVEIEGFNKGGASEVFLLKYKLGKTLGIGSFGKMEIAEHVLTEHKVEEAVRGCPAMGCSMASSMASKRRRLSTRLAAGVRRDCLDGAEGATAAFRAAEVGGWSVRGEIWWRRGNGWLDRLRWRFGWFEVG